MGHGVWSFTSEYIKAVLREMEEMINNEVSDTVHATKASLETAKWN